MTTGRSETLFRKRVRKFRRIKRGYYSFLIIGIAYVFSFFLPLILTNQAFLVKYNGDVLLPDAAVPRRL